MTKTFYIGLGGFGGRVVSEIKKQSEALFPSYKNTSFCILDMDGHDIHEFRSKTDVPCISLGMDARVSDCIDQYHRLGVEAWFPLTPYLLTAHMLSGVKTRTIARLAFLDAMETDKLQNLEALFQRELAVRTENVPKVRVVIVTSLCGNVGSGIFIQTALWIRKTLNRMFGISCEISGLFVGPKAFVEAVAVLKNDVNKKCYLFAHAKAALMELEWINGVKMGYVTPPVEKICLDGLFDSSDGADGTPVYDRVYLYEPVEESAERSCTYAELIERIARTLCVKFNTWLPESAKPVVSNSARTGLKVDALSTAVALYPKKAVLDYCALRTARRWVESWRDPKVRGIDCKKKANRFLTSLLERLRAELDRTDCFGKITKRYVPTDTDAALEGYVRDTLCYLEREENALLNDAPSIGDRLLHTVMIHKTGEIGFRSDNLFSLFAEQDEKGVLRYHSPQELRGILEELKGALCEMLDRAKEKSKIKCADDVLIPPGFGKRNLSPCKEIPFPLCVWEQNRIQRMFMPTGFRSNYVNWFFDYCKQYRKCAVGRAVQEAVFKTFPMLLKEVEELLVTMNDLEAWLLKVFDDHERYEQKRIHPDAVWICAGDAESEYILQNVSPYEKMEEICKNYAYAFWNGHCNRNWPHFFENGERSINHCYRDFFNGMLESVKNSILHASPEAVDFDVIEALLLQDKIAAGQNGTTSSPTALISDLFDRLCALSEEGLRNTQFESAELPDRRFTGVAFSRNISHKDYVEMALGLRVTFVESSDPDEKVLLCIRWCSDIELSNCPIMKSKECLDAYRSFFSVPTSQWEEWNPHLDKRWATLFYQA